MIRQRRERFHRVVTARQRPEVVAPRPMPVEVFCVACGHAYRTTRTIGLVVSAVLGAIGAPMLCPGCGARDTFRARSIE